MVESHSIVRFGRRRVPASRYAEAAETRLVSVALSGGPPPVAVPRLAGISSGDAQAALRRLGLRASVEAVPAPGVAAGTVTREVPSAGAHLFPGSTVSLAVAEIPRWRALTALTDRGGGSSVPFRIRGTRWRIVYRMSFDGVCTFLFVCSGPTAHVEDLGRGASTSSFGLNDGSDQTRTIDSGSGLFQIKVTPGSDTASWSMQVQDYY